VISKEHIEEVADMLNQRKISDLQNLEFVLWLCWLDQRAVFRELRIISVEEDFKVLCVYGIRVVINGKEFLNSIAAMELTEKYYVSVESATKEDWRMFVERIVEEEHPRVLPGYTFRKKLGLPESSSLFEVYVLSVDIREGEK